MSYPQTWKLETLGPQPGDTRFAEWLLALEQALDRFEIKIQQLIEAKFPESPNSFEVEADDVLSVVQDFGACQAEYTQISALIECYLAEAATSEIYRQAEGSFSALKPAFEKARHLLDQFLAQIPLPHWESLLETPTLTPVQGFLQRRRAEASLHLPEALADFAEEMNVNGLLGWSRLYDTLSGQIKIGVQEKGEWREKSPGQIAFDSPDRSQRENYFFASQKAWSKIAEPCAAAMNHLVGTRLTLDHYAERENYLVVPMMQNRVTEQAVEAMWAAITACKPELLAYFRTKQRLLQLPELCWYDLEAPLQSTTQKIDYDSACQTILQTFGQFHPPLQQFAIQAIEQGWIEVEDRAGKRQGGFCTDFPQSRETRIFMTYRNTEDSLSTLAHELGHAYHAWVLRDQPVVMQSYPMTLAETASTFAETVVAEQRLDQASEDNVRLATLDRLLGDAATYLMNIHCRWIYENEVYRQRRLGELSARQLTELMVAAQKTAYQNVLSDEGYNPTFWISKLHFYMSEEPFYNFPYTFGYLLSQRLYLEARRDPQGFPARYDHFLLSTAGPSAVKAARETFGFNMESQSFWEEALQPIRERLVAFQQLAENC